MDYKQELIKIYDECMSEIFKDEKLDEDDSLDMALLREAIISQVTSEKLTKEDETFVIDNLALYKRMFKSMLTDNEKELKLVMLDMLKIKNKTLLC